jgi:hypothetical protein
MAIVMGRDGTAYTWEPTTNLVCSLCTQAFVLTPRTPGTVNFMFEYVLPDPLERGEYWYFHKRCMHIERSLDVTWGCLALWPVLGRGFMGKGPSTSIQKDLQRRMPPGVYDRLYTQWLPSIAPHLKRPGPVVTTGGEACPVEQQRPGYVYVLLAEGTTRVKIGRTGNLPYRLDTLQTASPYPLKILRTVFVNDAVGFERKLHQQYRAYRKHNEWFELPPTVLQQLLEESFA